MFKVPLLFGTETTRKPIAGKVSFTSLDEILHCHRVLTVAVAVLNRQVAMDRISKPPAAVPGIT